MHTTFFRFFILSTAILLCACIMPSAGKSATHDAAVTTLPAQDKPDTLREPAFAPADIAEPAQPAISPVLPEDNPTAPVEKELSASARELYAYLLFVQAMQDEDEAALLDAAPLLTAASAPADIWMEGGIWLIRRKSPNAIAFLEEALKSQPEDLSLNLLHSEALGDHGLASRGVENMRNYLQRHPDSLDARLELALLLVKDKQFDAAQKLLGDISPRERTPLVDYYQALALKGMDRISEAIPYFKKAVKGMPDFVEALAELAFAYEQDGNLREARATYDRLKKFNFSPQEVTLRLVNLSLRLKQPNQALQYIKQGPNTLPFKLTAANMLIEARHYLQAEGILKQIAASDRAPVEVYLLLADLAFEHRRNLPAALAWLDKIPDPGAMGARIELLRAQLMAEAGKMQDALKTAKAASAAFPDAPELSELEIRLLARDKNRAEALKAALAAHNKWPDNTQLAFLYASLLDENDERAKALDIMEDILKKEPENFQAMNYIGFTLAEQDRDLDRAIRLLDKANTLSPDQGYIVDSLAWAHFKAGNNAEALKLIRRAAGLGEHNDPAIWDHYGDIAMKEGRKDEARRAWKKALELKPANSDTIRQKLSRL